MLRALALILALCILCAHTTAPPYSSCWDGDSDCPSCAEYEGKLNFVSYLYLYEFEEFRTNMMEAQHIIRENGNKTTIFSTQEPLTFHISVNYFCCYTLQQRAQIVDLMRKVRWAPLALNITGEGCNLDHNQRTVYLHALPDPPSQARLAAFVSEVEALMREAGIPVHTPRAQAFHSTLARVSRDYPSDKVLDMIGQAIPVFGTFAATWMEVAGTVLRATE